MKRTHELRGSAALTEAMPAKSGVVDYGVWLRFSVDVFESGTRVSSVLVN